ncbi:MAG: AAA family ATPase [Deltaproteobacteria bacterium]|nr:AAA family ATPase [Deltaproteobacteria bacterium]
MHSGRLRLEGWKGFKASVRLWPVTFLVGPNGSGKSSLLEALSLLSHLARRGTLGDDLRVWLRGWPDGVFTRLGPGSPASEAKIEIEWGKTTYSLTLEHPQKPEIQSESLVVGPKRFIKTDTRGGRRFRTFVGQGAGRGLETSDPLESALGLFSRSPKRRKGAQRVIDLLTDIEVYSLDADFLRGTAVDTRPVPYARKGTGLVSGLIDAHRDESIWKALLDAVRSVQPDLEDIATTLRPRGALLKYAGGRETQLDEESDGLVRAIGMFLARYRSNCPSILGFDEPENGFHLSRLVDVVTHLSPGPAGAPSPQLVVLATHSPEMVYRAARSLKNKMGVLTLWRSKEGAISVGEWPGTDLQDNRNFDLLRAEGFLGR